MYGHPPRTPLSSFQCICCIDIAFHHVFLEMLPANVLHEINILRLFGEGPLEKKTFEKTQKQKKQYSKALWEGPLEEI